MTNDGRFRKNMAGLGETFDKEITEALAIIYWRAFEDWTDDQFKDACNKYVNKPGTTFFPRPGQLREVESGNNEAQALEAWEHLQQGIQRAGQYQSVQFQDSRITRVIESMGGWEAVCLWEYKDLSFRRHEFLRTYAALTGDAGPPRPLAGLIEQDNQGRGYLVSPLEPVVVGVRGEQRKIEGGA